MVCWWSCFQGCVCIVLYFLKRVKMNIVWNEVTNYVLFFCFCLILLFVTVCKYEWCVDDLVFKDAFVLYCIFWNEIRWISFEIKKWLTRFCFFVFLILLFVTGCKYEMCLLDLVSKMRCIAFENESRWISFEYNQMTNQVYFFLIW